MGRLQKPASTTPEPLRSRPNPPVLGEYANVLMDLDRVAEADAQLTTVNLVPTMLSPTTTWARAQRRGQYSEAKTTSERR